MADRYSGECVGGPLDGQMLVHWARTKSFMRPMAYPLLADNVEAVEIGEYRINDFGQWHWWETKEGAALDVLYGPASPP